MRIGLHQADGKWPNLALMKLSAWHKTQGDTVEWFMPLRSCDRVYSSKVFIFTLESEYLPDGTIKGGTGYDVTTQLPPDVECCCPDYSLYPGKVPAMGFTTRGCVRHCPFCVVPCKEGAIRIVSDILSFWRGQDSVILLDNNLTAAPWDHFRLVLQQAISNRLFLDITQGLDLRLLTDEQAELLAQTRRRKRVRFAWDQPGDEAAIRVGLQTALHHFSPRDIAVYVLVGFNTDQNQDLHRIRVLHGLGVNPFVMPFNRSDGYQRRLARWCNHKAIFKSVPWEDYRGRRQCGG